MPKVSPQRGLNFGTPRYCYYYKLLSMGLADWYINKDTIIKIGINLPIKPFDQKAGGKYHTFANIF